jgi:hypothetical protein
VPAFLPPGLHDLEAWSERVAAGAWGRTAAPVGELVRRALSLEHWSAFGDAWERLARLIEATAAGSRGRPPETILVLTGEVHHGALARIAFAAGAGVRSAVWQAVSSPLRNPLRAQARRLIRIAQTRGFAAFARAAARLAGVPRPRARWEGVAGPLFANHVAVLDLDGRRARLAVLGASAGSGEPALVPLAEHELSP